MKRVVGLNRLLAAAVVAGILVSGSARVAEPGEWCKAYGLGTSHFINPQWNSCASNFLYVFMTKEQLVKWTPSAGPLVPGC